jgi:hypothetical protein
VERVLRTQDKALPYQAKAFEETPVVRVEHHQGHLRTSRKLINRENTSRVIEFRVLT